MKTKNMATQSLVRLDYDTARTVLKQVDTVLATVIDQVGGCSLIQEQRTGDVLPSLANGAEMETLSHDRSLVFVAESRSTAQSA